MRKMKLVCGVLAALVAAVNMSSCLPEKIRQSLETEPKETFVDYDTQEDAVLTGVFKGSAIKLDKDLTPDDGVKVCVKGGEITFYCTRQIETGEGFIIEHFLCTADENGSVGEAEKLNIDESFYARIGLVTEEKVYLIYPESSSGTADSTYVLLTYDRTDGGIAKAEGLETMFPSTGEPFTYVSSIAVDGDGYVYLAADGGICVLKPDLSKVFDCFSSGFRSSLSTDKSGVVYVTSETSTNAVDRELHGLGEELKLPDGAAAKSVYFGEGYECYYWMADGLYGFSSGMESGELVMSWQNSNLNPTSISDLSVLSHDRIFVSYRDTLDNKSQYRNSIFTKAGDVFLSDSTKVSVAYLNSVLSPLPQQVINYNRNNPEMRVVTEDYESYNNRENGMSGARTKLMNDMISGIHTPDVIFVEATNRIISDIVKNDLYLDLYTLIENDPDIDKDDIVGAVKNTYEIDGRLSAVTPSFRLQTVLAPKSAVGDRTSWTLDELLDFEKSLGDDVLLTKDKDMLLWGESTFSSFVNLDDCTCDFNNATFVKLIEYLSKPQKEIIPGSNRCEPYQTGKIILAQKEYSYVDSYRSDEVLYNSRDYVRIGNPTEVGNGCVISYGYAYIITKNAAHPKEAWEFIRSIILDKPDYELFGKSGIRMLKSQNESYREDVKDIFEFHPFNASHYSSGVKKEENMLDENGMLDGEAGIYIEYREEDFDSFMEFVDSSGAPVRGRLPFDVLDIINEEITAYQGGLRSAEDTAKIIQSRVSIYLAERK